VKGHGREIVSLLSKGYQPMITNMRHRTPVLRTLHIVGVILITTLFLLVGSILPQLPGFALVSFAHAKETKTMAVHGTALCVSEPTDQHCTNQDPMMQGCSQDAQTIAFIEVYNPQMVHLARVERRYSPTCHTEWGRIVKDGNGTQPIQISIAKETSRSSLGKVLYSLMVFVPVLGVAPIIRGDISINGIGLNAAGGAGYGAVLKPAM
jgi:Protein of unknown function (DUF2690)